MIKACDIKRSTVVSFDGIPHIVEDLQVQTPSARGGATLYKVRFRNVKTRQKLDQTFKGDDPLKETDLDRQEIQYLFSDSAGLTFMNLADYSQFTIPAEELEDERRFLIDGLEGIMALISDGRVLGIELPPTVELEVVATDPGMRGASATARTKPATLSTGHVIRVPEYLEKGEMVRVDTRTGEFLGRA